MSIMTLFPFLRSALRQDSNVSTEVKERRRKIELYRNVSALFTLQRGCEEKRRAGPA